MTDHVEMTQMYSTWGDKLLQHTDVLYSIQEDRTFKPITIQIALCEVCDDHCSFCSVAARPLKRKMTWDQLVSVLTDFKELGAKAVEFTGGGNPLLWKHKDIGISEAINIADLIGYDVGVITNSAILGNISQSAADVVSWVRISLPKLDGKLNPEDYDFCNVSETKIGLSYIIHEGTTVTTIRDIEKLVKLHSQIKFVRIAGDQAGLRPKISSWI